MIKASFDDFKEVVFVTKDMMDSNKIRIIIPSDFEVRLSILDDKPLESISEKIKMDMKIIYSIIKMDIAKYISIALNGEASIIFSPQLEAKEKERVEFIREYLICDKIKNMYLVKSTTKTNTLNSIDWEISKKVFDDEEGKLPDLKYITVNINFNKPSFVNGILKMLDAKSQNSVSMVCDLSDIDVLIDTFENIRNVFLEQEDISNA